MLTDNLLGPVALDPLCASVPAGHPAVESQHIDRVIGDALDQPLELLLATSKRHSGSLRLRFERLIQPLFAALHAQGDADKGGQFRYRASVNAVEMPFPIGDDPQRPQRHLLTEIKRDEQDLVSDDVGVSYPTIDSLRMQREDLRI